MKNALTISVALLASCLQAGAVTLTVEQGGVKLNQGKGFQPVRGTVEAKVGDLVKVDAKGRASLVSGDRVVVLKRGVTRVIDPSAASQSRDWMASTEQPAPGVSPLGFNPLYLLGGLAVAGGIAGVVAGTSGGGGSNNNAAIAALLLAQQNQKPVSK